MKMIALFVVVALLHTELIAIPQFTVPDNARELYEEFKLKYAKYRSNEVDDERRFVIFKENLIRAQIHQYHDRGTAKYGVTRFSDLTAEEFRKHFRTTVLNDNVRPNIIIEAQVADEPVKQFDWRTVGAVGPVLNQGFCGSCWAFSVMGNIEGQWYLKTDTLYKFSKQQLVDCDAYDYGCRGGNPVSAYESLIMMGGIETDKSYPYAAREDKCGADINQFIAYINNSALIQGSEEAIANELKNRGPLSMCLNAEYIQFYLEGISHPPEDLCSAESIDHAVLGVGFGEDEEGRPYWLIKNSWGTDWGEQGYFRLYRGDKTCGIDSLVTTAIIE